jgi:hypothetical protein
VFLLWPRGVPCGFFMPRARHSLEWRARMAHLRGLRFPPSLLGRRIGRIGTVAGRVAVPWEPLTLFGALLLASVTMFDRSPLFSKDSMFSRRQMKSASARGVVRRLRPNLNVCNSPDMMYG